ncbi:MAG: amidohydrolase family protein [Oscillospiraceae bacterium]
MVCKIFFGGKILTMTGETPEAIMVQDGVVTNMGKRNDIFKLASSDTIHINLHNTCLMPSFIDSHSHLSQYAISLRSANLSECKNFDEIIKMLSDYKTSNHLKKGDWVVGFGYDHNNLEEKSHPTKECFDSVFPENPVLISHVSGHMGVVNSQALKLANIDATTKNVQGGMIGKDKNNEPNGYIEENTFFSVSSIIPQASLEEKIKLLKKAQKVYLQYGITTVQDGMLGKDDFELLKIASINHILVCDVVGYADLKKAPTLLSENPEYNKRYNDNLKLGGYKIFLDGSPQGRTAWLTKPYNKVSDSDSEDYVGYPVYKDDEIQNFIKIADSEDEQLLAHCNGDAAIQQFVKFCPEDGKMRPVIIHAQIMPIDALDEIKRKGIIPSYFVAHTYYWGDTHIENLGFERAKKISPAKSTLAKNIPFTFHQDTPVLVPDMMKTIWCAVNRKTKDGVTIGEYEKISTFDALKAITINAAYQYFEENSKGTIEIGKKADFVVLSQNPVDCQKEKLDKIQVLATYKNGMKVYQSDMAQ